VPASRFPCYLARPHRAYVGPNVTNIEKEGEGAIDAQPAPEEEETLMRGSRKSEEGDAISNLLLKHPDATLPTYV
jgi:hypothetical protein